MKYQFIENEKSNHAVTTLCRTLEVSSSGYYGWLKRTESPRSKKTHALLNKIIAIHEESVGRYGAPRIHAELQAQGESVGKNTVAKLMKSSGIQSKTHRRFEMMRLSRCYKRTRGKTFNRLNREFTASKPNEKWVSDTTQIRTRKGWLYLSMIMDLYSRQIIGWSMSKTNKETLVINALEMALARRGNVKGVLLHSDQGSTYMSWNYRQLMRGRGIVSSHSRRGNCWDNAPAESFFHTLKTELVMFEDYKTTSDAEQSIFYYIESFYNRKRRHSTIGYRSPVEYEELPLVA